MNPQETNSQGLIAIHPCSPPCMLGELSRESENPLLSCRVMKSDNMALIKLPNSSSRNGDSLSETKHKLHGLHPTFRNCHKLIYRKWGMERAGASLVTLVFPFSAFMRLI